MSRKFWDKCVFCGGRIGPRGWVVLALFERNANVAYKTGYICKKCQKKHGIDPAIVKKGESEK